MRLDLLLDGLMRLSLNSQFSALIDFLVLVHYEQSAGDASAHVVCFSPPKLFTGSENPVVDDIYILSGSQSHCPPLPRPQCDLNILDNLDKTGSHLISRKEMWKESHIHSSILMLTLCSLDECEGVRV